MGLGTVDRLKNSATIGRMKPDGWVDPISVWSRAFGHERMRPSTIEAIAFRRPRRRGWGDVDARPPPDRRMAGAAAFIPSHAPVS
jgi:hypothetical protein